MRGRLSLIDGDFFAASRSRSRCLARQLGRGMLIGDEGIGGVLLLLATLGVDGLQSKLKISLEARDFFFLTSGVRGDDDGSSRPSEACSDGSSSWGDPGAVAKRGGSNVALLSAVGRRNMILRQTDCRAGDKGQRSPLNSFPM